jgi:hypothetical protein
MVGMSALYGWLYLGWLDRLDAASDDTLLQLTRKGERLRWRTAAVAMWIVLLEVCLRRVVSWGIYLAVFAGATGYF